MKREMATKVPRFRRKKSSKYLAEILVNKNSLCLAD
jgi:hypothetical protein